MEEQGGNRQVIDDTNPLTLREYMLGEECIDALGILDSDLNIIQLSKRWQELLGRDPQKIKDIAFRDLIHPLDKTTTISDLKRCQNENSSLESEIRLLNADGESAWIHLRAVPMPERKLVFVSVYNITPLKDKIGQLDNFFTLSPDLFSVIDFKGHFIRVNPAWQRLLGWTTEQLMSEEFLSFVHVEDRERTAIQYANNMEGADTVLFENRLRSVNGTPRWVEWKSVTLLEEQIIFAIARDVTSRKLYQSKQKEVEVEKATNQAKSVFLAAMSHELKTPLNGVVGLANLAHSEATTDSLKELLGSLKESADSLIKIVDDIFDYSAIDSGEIEFDPQPFSLRSIITDIEQSYSPQAKKKELQLNSEFDLSLPDIVVSDANRISQVLRNLVDNAIRFTEEGSVTIKVQSCLPIISHHSKFEKPKKSDENRVWVRISVIDSGIGIPMKEQLRIFDVFRQAAEFLKRKRGGLGIGLTVSKHLVELLGGHLELSSKLGEGSEFSFDIPFTVSDGSTIQDKEEEENDHPIPPLKILVVEDNVINQKIVVRYLSNQGHSVMVAENGHLGIEAFESNLFDVILMDIQMPEMDGLTATRYIRELEAQGETRTPIVAMTAHAAKSDEEACYEVGMDEFLVKPYRPAKLKSVLQKIARNKTHNNQKKLRRI